MSNIIKALRVSKGYTQEAVAHKIGIHSRTYCLKEKNPDNFTVSEIKALAEVLEVKEEVFFKNKLADLVS